MKDRASTKMPEFAPEMAVLKRLRKIRAYYRNFSIPGFQVKELAQFCRVTPRTINNWVRGQTKPSEAKLALIKDWLDTRPKAEKFVPQ